MDVYCATCNEPWEHYHLLNDLVWDAWDGVDDSSSHLLIKKFLRGPKTSIPEMLRKDLEGQGWKFGRTIVCVLECCCCASNACEPDRLSDEEPAEDHEGFLNMPNVKLRKELRLEAEQLMGDDLDGLISTLTTIDHFAEIG